MPFQPSSIKENEVEYRLPIQIWDKLGLKQKLTSVKLTPEQMLEGIDYMRALGDELK